MMTLRRIHELQDQRGLVRLADGRVGKIIRVDTTFPGNRTEVSVYTQGSQGPGIAKVGLDRLSPALGESRPGPAGGGSAAPSAEAS